MYRILSASADTYLTNKIIENSRSLDSNVGQAGTLDLYKLYGQSTLTSETGSLTELSRILMKFDYSMLTLADVSNVNFTASLILKDVYGGQTVPSNFTLALYPLSKAFDEGRGSDVVSYKDLDTANFLYSSTGISWSLSGANASGSLNNPNIDYIISGNLGNGVQGLGSYYTFARGDEDANFNITNLVSASVAGILPNHGFRISFTTTQETDNVTRFVKRFGSRHTFNKALQPKIHIGTTDNINDLSGNPMFGTSQSFYIYNNVNGNLQDFYSGSTTITNLKLALVASKSISVTTSSFQANFNAIITYISKSIVYFSQSFSGSKISTGIYSSSIILDQTNDSSLSSFLGTNNEFTFKGTWTDTTGNVNLNTDYYVFKKIIGIQANSQEKNYIVNAVNLKESYTKQDQIRVRVVVQDYDLMQIATKYPTRFTSVILSDMRWRLKKAYTNDIVVPFSLATKMSTDHDGMYFDLFVEDLDINEVYELEFLINNNFGKDTVIQNKGFVFKVVV